MNGMQITLMDINPKMLDCQQLIKKMVAQSGLSVQVNATTSRHEALKQANFVISTIQVGGFNLGDWIWIFLLNTE